jgi:hypothetical protein
MTMMIMIHVTEYHRVQLVMRLKSVWNSKSETTEESKFMKLYLKGTPLMERSCTRKA